MRKKRSDALPADVLVANRSAAQAKYLASDKGRSTRKATAARRQADPVAHQNQLEMTQNWRERNQQYIKEYAAEHQPQYLYNLSPAEYAAMLMEYENRCGICGCSPTHKRLAIDHDHKCCPGRKSCGKCVRGLLCSNCNHILGQANDSLSVLQRAMDYLNGFRSESSIG